MSKTRCDIDATATLHLTVVFTGNLADVVDATKEIVEKVRECGRPEGFLEIHHADRIDVDQL